MKKSLSLSIILLLAVIAIQAQSFKYDLVQKHTKSYNWSKWSICSDDITVEKLKGGNYTISIGDYTTYKVKFDQVNYDGAYRYKLQGGGFIICNQKLSHIAGGTMHAVIDFFPGGRAFGYRLSKYAY